MTRFTAKLLLSKRKSRISSVLHLAPQRPSLTPEHPRKKHPRLKAEDLKITGTSSLLRLAVLLLLLLLRDPRTDTVNCC